MEHKHKLVTPFQWIIVTEKGTMVILITRWFEMVVGINIHFPFSPLSLFFLFPVKFSKLVKLKKDQANLPISHFREEIVDAIGSNQVVIIAGDTGCGKSTQVTLMTGFLCLIKMPMNVLMKKMKFKKLVMEFLLQISFLKKWMTSGTKLGWKLLQVFL